MALVTIQLIEGLERGQVFEELPTPVSIGREDDNSVRLNDERPIECHPLDEIPVHTHSLIDSHD